MRTARLAWVALALALAACSAGRSPGTGATNGEGSQVPSGSGSASGSGSEAAGQHVLDRVAVVGASVSAGLAARPIAASLREGLPAGADVLDQADVMFFRDPQGNGRAQVEAAAAHRPTLVLAVDFLFWFAYADLPPDARLARLDEGLALLATLPGTLAVGDLPDMRNANPRILGPAAVPSPDELAAMNARIRAWAAARPRTVVLPLAAWTRPLVTGAEIELAPGERVPASQLMFLDGLHANLLGTWHLLDEIDHALERDLGVPAAALRLARPRP